LLACLLWQDVLEGWAARRGGLSLNTSAGVQQFAKIPTFPALVESVDAVFEERIGDVSGRGKLAADMREIWTMQPRFEKRTGTSPYSLVGHIRFRAGFDFLCLRSHCPQEDHIADLQELAQWWEAFQTADADARAEMIETIRAKPKSAAGPAGEKSSKPRRKRKPKPPAPSE
jgi:poly(A) polymerase